MVKTFAQQVLLALLLEHIRPDALSLSILQTLGDHEELTDILIEILAPRGVLLYPKGG